MALLRQSAIGGAGTKKFFMGFGESGNDGSKKMPPAERIGF